MGNLSRSQLAGKRRKTRTHIQGSVEQPSSVHYTCSLCKGPTAGKPTCPQKLGYSRAGLSSSFSPLPRSRCALSKQVRCLSPGGGPPCSSVPASSSLLLRYNPSSASPQTPASAPSHQHPLDCGCRPGDIVPNYRDHPSSQFSSAQPGPAPFTYH